MKAISLFFEQRVYSEALKDTFFLTSLRKLKARYIYQVDITRAGVKTSIGVIKRFWFTEPNIDRYTNALIAALTTQQTLPFSAFGVIKQLPQWEIESQLTLALELKESPAIFREKLLVRPYLVSPTEQQEESKIVNLLHAIAAIVRGSEFGVCPLSIQVIFEPRRPGTTRMSKEKKMSGKKWSEDTHKILQQEIRNLENTRGKDFGYWSVSVRVLAPNYATHLLGVLNVNFSFKQVNSKRAIRKHREVRFGKRIGMSSPILQSLIPLVTTQLFPKETLKAPSYAFVKGRPHLLNPYEENGYILGQDQDGNIISLTDDMLRAHVLVVGGTGTRKTSLIRLTAIEFHLNPTNRIFIFDYAGEYYHLLERDFILLRPGSIEFPIGINFLDWPRTLGLDVYVVESWILKILSNFVKDRGDFSPKMEAMLRDTIRGLLEQGGNLVTLIENLKSLKTELDFTKKQLREKQRQGHELSEDERVTLSDIGQHDPTVEALVNRLTDLYGSPLRSVFFVEETTLSPQDLLQSNVIFDLSQLRREMAKPEHLRLLIEFLLLYLSQGILDREKELWDTRNIMIIEEAQLITPEIFTKLTAIDGSQSEEILGTLGGFGLSLMFVSAQPHKLSKSIIAGTHTSIVFGVKPGVEAKQLAQILGVGNRELSLLQPGHCLVWSRGRGITNIKAKTLAVISKYRKTALEAMHDENPPAILRKTREKYVMLKKPPKGVYASILDTIRAEEPHASKDSTRTLNAKLKPVSPKFSFQDEFCKLCPLSKALRDEFCISYREQIIEDLSDPEVLNPLKIKFEKGYELFLTHCFRQSENPAVNVCTVATFLSFVPLSKKQRQILFEITRKFIAKHPESS